MNHNNDELSKKAKHILQNKNNNQKSIDYQNIEKLMNEFKIQQIELELKNEELQKTNRKLEAEKLKFKNLYMDAPVAYFTLTPTGNIIETNLAAARMLKTPIEKIRYTSVFLYLTEQSKKDFEKTFNNLFQKTKTKYGEIVFENSDGEIIITQLNTVCYYDTDLETRLCKCTVTDITDAQKNKAELELQSEMAYSEKKMRTMFENNGVVILLINPENGKIEDANPAATKFYGYSIHDLKRMSISDINTMPEKEISKKLKEVVSHGGQKINRFKHKLSNNDIRDVEVYSNIIDFDDKPKLFSIVHDITNRRAAERKIVSINKELSEYIEKLEAVNKELASKNKLIDSEREQFLSILNNIPELIYICDPDTHELLFANKTLKDNLNRDITGEKCYKVLQNSDIICDFCTNHIITKQKEPYFWDHYNPIINKHFYVMDRMIKWLDGRKVRFEMAIDLTKQKLAEQKIAHRLKYEENLARFSNTLLLQKENAIEQALQYILIASDSSRIYIFENFIDDKNRLSMKQTHEVCAQEVDPQIENPDLQHVIYREHGFGRWEKILAAKRIINGRVSEFPKSERKILEPQDIKSILIIPILMHHKWFGFIGFDDVINHRQWSKEDVELLRTVSEIVGLYIENQQNKATILKRNEELQEANATKDKFFSIVAHDLKNPFNSIIGFTELLKINIQKYDNQKIEHFITAIYESGKSTYKLLENLLEWSRAQTGRIQFEPTKVIIESMVLDVIQQTASAANAKNINVDYDISEAMIVMADPNMLNTVLRNLISNAVKFTKHGGKINISVTQNNKETIFTVSDTGIGMPDKILKKLFRIEEKTNREGTNNEKGTGIGLLLCKEFVEKHKGKLWVESEVGKGSNFIFSLPS